MNLHSEWLMGRRSGEVSFTPGTDVEGAYTCPSHLEARRHIVATYRNAAFSAGMVVPAGR